MPMFEIHTTDTFDKWLKKLKDRHAVRAINLRIARAREGNLGDIKPVGDSLSEMRIFIGKGYRIYYTRRQNRLILLLCGGHKGTQQKDIDKAKQLLAQLE